MDLVPFLNSGFLANIKSEKETPTEFLDDPETERNCANYLNIDQKPKYGRVLVSASGKYTLFCDGCKGRFDSTDSFARHAKGAYSTCGIWKDSNDGISINKAAFERGDFRTKGNCLMVCVENKVKLLCKFLDVNVLSDAKFVSD